MSSIKCLLGNISPEYSRIEVIEDTKIPNAATVKIVKQDHTLANMLRQYVHKTPFGIYYTMTHSCF